MYCPCLIRCTIDSSFFLWVLFCLQFVALCMPYFAFVLSCYNFVTFVLTLCLTGYALGVVCWVQCLLCSISCCPVWVGAHWCVAWAPCCADMPVACVARPGTSEWIRFGDRRRFLPTPPFPLFLLPLPPLHFCLGSSNIFLYLDTRGQKNRTDETGQKGLGLGLAEKEKGTGWTGRQELEQDLVSSNQSTF